MKSPIRRFSLRHKVSEHFVRANNRFLDHNHMSTYKFRSPVMPLLLRSATPLKNPYNNSSRFRGTMLEDEEKREGQSEPSSANEVPFLWIFEHAPINSNEHGERVARRWSGSPLAVDRFVLVGLVGPCCQRVATRCGDDTWHFSLSTFICL